MICEQCKAERAHITHINYMLRWLCWDCTKKKVLENKEKEKRTTFLQEERTCQAK